MWSGFGTRNETRLKSSWDLKMIDTGNFTCMNREIERAIATVIITRYPSLAEGKHNQEKKGNKQYRYAYACAFPPSLPAPDHHPPADCLP